MRQSEPACWQPLLQSLGVYACLDSRGLPNMLPCPCLWHLTWHGRVEHSDVFARAHRTDLAPPLPSPAVLAAHVRVHAAITSPLQPRPVTPAVRDYRLSRHKSGVIAEQKCCHTLSKPTSPFSLRSLPKPGLVNSPAVFTGPEEGSYRYLVRLAEPPQEAFLRHFSLHFWPALCGRIPQRL
jgi:hypothetical protein